MCGKKRSRGSCSKEDRWIGALRLPLRGGLYLELVGLDSPARTIFVRLRTEEPLKPEQPLPKLKFPVEEIVDCILDHIFKTSPNTEPSPPIGREEVITSQPLLQLGAVWILDPASSDRPQNRPVWKRLWHASQSDTGEIVPSTTASMSWIDSSMTLRVHTRPPRFPAASDFRTSCEYDGIVLEQQDSAVSFAILNKPSGLPSHATVDNTTENLLYQYQQFRRLPYASLPQRLDTETSGLILVATTPCSASYFSKLFQRKTDDATNNDCSESSSPIQKRYRCLVSVDSKERFQIIRDAFATGERTVEHYMDAKSRAPKVFVEDISGSVCPNRKWLLCRLNIQSMKDPIRVHPFGWVCQLEIELLTGRTHQIRGQLAALGCPIVGDPLYGICSGVQHYETNRQRARTNSRMALQCCRLAFSLDKVEDDDRAPPHIDVRLDTAWWSELLDTGG